MTIGEAPDDFSPWGRAGLRAMLDAATVLYRRKGQRRAAKSAQFQRVLALRKAVAKAP